MSGALTFWAEIGFYPLWQVGEVSEDLFVKGAVILPDGEFQNECSPSIIGAHIGIVECKDLALQHDKNKVGDPCRGHGFREGKRPGCSMDRPKSADPGQAN